jgi:hypothetical protein
MQRLQSALAAELSSDPRFPALLSVDRPVKLLPYFKVDDPSATEVLRAARDEFSSESADTKGVYWPETALTAVGRRAGFVEPQSDNGGWPKRLVLAPDHIEALILMFSSPDSKALGWSDFWGLVAENLGLRVGANLSRDAHDLRQAGLNQVNPVALSVNAEQLLAIAVTRGVARRLPDSGAEVGGGLQ